MANLRQFYGFDFPDDLRRVWDLARRVRPLEPLRAFEDTLHLELVGPFHILAGRFDRHTPRYPIAQHWRTAWDPPELFTVFAGSNGLHWGYWIDAPGESTPCVVAVYPDQGFEPDRYGDDLMEALRLHLEELAEDGEMDMDAVRQRLFGNSPVQGHIGGATARDAGVIAPTLDGLGIVAPPGTYRQLSVSDRVLAERIWEEEPPADLLAEALRACDDGCPATALKLGRDLWQVPEAAHYTAAYDLLDRAYAGLGREVLRGILADHRRCRDREWLDILDQEANENEPGEPGA
jgi:hypothetical protein